MLFISAHRSVEKSAPSQKHICCNRRRRVLQTGSSEDCNFHHVLLGRTRGADT